MLAITIKTNEESGISDNQDLINIATALDNEFYKKRFLIGIHAGYKTSIGADRIEIKFRGFISDESATNYIVRKINAMIQDLGLYDFVQVSNARILQKDEDKLLSCVFFEPRMTNNATLLKNIKDSDKTPEKFKCQLTGQVMDNPVHTSKKPEVFYDREHLIYCLYSQGIPKDPITQEVLNVSQDILPDPELKQEINEFVHSKFKENLSQKRLAKQKFIDVLHKYSTVISQESVDKAFRHAAGSNNVIDLDIIYPYISHIDAQDNNPIRRRTALHWAIENHAPEAIKYLLNLNAQSNIPDARGKTALDYADTTNDSSIKAILNGEIEEKPTNKLRQ